MAEKNREKDHADFQDKYRRSSNFGKEKKDDNLKIEGDGVLKTEEDERDIAREEKEDIDEVNKSLREKDKDDNRK